MSEDSSFLIRICHSSSPRLSGYGCCLDKGAADVFTELQNLLQSYQLQDRVEIRAVNCLKNCHQGISVQVLPGPIWYGKIQVEDLKTLIESHLLQDELLKERRVPNPNSLF